MSYSLLFDQRTEEEAASAFEYYYEIHDELAYNFYKNLDQIYDQLEENPNIYQLVSRYPKGTNKAVPLRCFLPHSVPEKSTDRIYPPHFPKPRQLARIVQSGYVY